MREIKFRIWDKENKVFHYTESITTRVELVNGNKFTNGKITAYPKITFTGQIGIPVDSICSNPSNYIIQQATGVPDKNGKEIYEGDVIAYHGDVGFVEFTSGIFICAWPDQTDDDLGYMITPDMEIIGVKNS